MNIRPANPNDVEFVVEAITATLGSFGTHSLGFGDARLATQVIRRFFVLPRNRFSHQITEIADVDEKPAGLLISFHGKTVGSLYRSMAKQVWGIYGFSKTLRLIFSSAPQKFGNEFHADDQYIAHLAVAAPFQRHGLGRILMLHAEEKARCHKLPRCSLWVEEHNQPASNLYSSLGYKVVETYSPIFGGVHLENQVKMVKTLSY